jgi:hypothetical protein
MIRLATKFRVAKTTNVNNFFLFNQLLMKTSFPQTVLSLAALLISTVHLFAQAPERIDFKKEGSPSLVWEQKVKANGSKDFVFYAKKGQKLTLSLIDDTGVGSMDLGKVSIQPNTDGYESIVEVSKDYRLTVSNQSDKETSFRIAISLENTKKSGKTKAKASNDKKETVRFAKGANSAALTRSIPASGARDFNIWAKKGQTIEFTIGYDFDDSHVQGFLTEPGLQDIALTTGPKSPNTFKLERTGNHRLTVQNYAEKNITITLYLSIE